jgi:hypothetical protein
MPPTVITLSINSLLATDVAMGLDVILVIDTACAGISRCQIQVWWFLHRITHDQERYFTSI